MDRQDEKALRAAALATPTDLSSNAVRDISGSLNILLADMFALYLKTKNFHWHVSGPHFRDYHLLLDEQAEQIFAATDAIAERVLDGVGRRSQQNPQLIGEAGHEAARGVGGHLIEVNGNHPPGTLDAGLHQART